MYQYFVIRHLDGRFYSNWQDGKDPVFCALSSDAHLFATVGLAERTVYEFKSLGIDCYVEYY